MTCVTRRCTDYCGSEAARFCGETSCGCVQKAKYYSIRVLCEPSPFPHPSQLGLSENHHSTSPQPQSIDTMWNEAPSNMRSAELSGNMPKFLYWRGLDPRSLIQYHFEEKSIYFGPCPSYLSFSPSTFSPINLRHNGHQLRISPYHNRNLIRYPNYD